MKQVVTILLTLISLFLQAQKYTLSIGGGYVQSAQAKNQVNFFQTSDWNHNIHASIFSVVSKYSFSEKSNLKIHLLPTLKGYKKNITTDLERYIINNKSEYRLFYLDIPITYSFQINNHISLELGYLNSILLQASKTGNIITKTRDGKTIISKYTTTSNQYVPYNYGISFGVEKKITDNITVSALFLRSLNRNIIYNSDELNYNTSFVFQLNYKLLTKK